MSPGRPKVSVRMEYADRDKLKAVAKAQHITVSELLRTIIDNYLKSK